MSGIERSEAQMRVAMESPQHLRDWLVASGREWIVLRGDDLVKALPWPEGVDSFIQFCQVVRDYRATIDSGRTEKQRDPLTNEMVEIPVFKSETLEVEELDRAIRYLIGQVTSLDPSWSLENPPQ